MFMLKKTKTMAASRSSELMLYAAEDKSDNDLKVHFQASSADFVCSGSQDMKFDFGSFQIKGASDQYFNVQTRFEAAEAQQSSDAGALATSVAANQTAIAQEQVDRAAQDTVLGNQISAEISARATAVQAVQDELDDLYVKVTDKIVKEGWQDDALYDDAEEEV